MENDRKENEKIFSYTAGIIDGEGYIGAYKEKRGKYTRYQVKLSVKMTDKKVISWLHSLYGGNMRIIKAAGNRKQAYNWEVTATLAINCLEKVLPYMITKQANAALIIQFYKNLVNKSHQYQGELHHFRSLNESEIEARDKIVREIKLLNKKGGDYQYE